jgi:hypothetical protein
MPLSPICQISVVSRYQEITQYFDILNSYKSDAFVLYSNQITCLSVLLNKLLMAVVISAAGPTKRA